VIPSHIRAHCAAAARLAIVAAVAFLAAAGAGCGKKQAAGPPPPARPESLESSAVAVMKSQFEDFKAQWNALMKSADSPLPEAAVASFPGLRFHPFDPSWRFVGDLERFAEPRDVLLPDTKGKRQHYLEYGTYPFERGGQTYRLTVYRPIDHPEQFFIAYMDSTSGVTTYAGGRYVHLDSLDVHKFVLDFNRSYNPYCAYDSSWMCPLPPPQNTLPIAVTAGMLDAPGH
jgi:hypothetical protein